jgi:uncharacterized protein involved in exopolysaccharide biosynthesis
MNATAGALLRFWWLVVAGIAAGALAALLVYSLQSEAKHTATTRVFVNSPSAPYLRTQQSQAATPKVRTVRNATGGTRTVKQPPAISSEAPDTQTLVNAANLYPLLIESDRISSIREAQAGTIPGTVKANALNSSTNTFGVFRPSSLPVVEVKATSGTANNASKLATATVDAFRTWIVDQQRGAGIPSAQRITVPALPGSRMLAQIATRSGAVARASGRGTSTKSQSATTPCGLTVSVSTARASSSTRCQAASTRRAAPRSSG